MTSTSSPVAILLVTSILRTVRLSNTKDNKRLTVVEVNCQGVSGLNCARVSRKTQKEKGERSGNAYFARDRRKIL